VKSNTERVRWSFAQVVRLIADWVLELFVQRRAVVDKDSVQLLWLAFQQFEVFISKLGEALDGLIGRLRSPNRAKSVEEELGVDEKGRLHENGL
jgi:hypothetical protein